MRPEPPLPPISTRTAAPTAHCISAKAHAPRTPTWPAGRGRTAVRATRASKVPVHNVIVGAARPAHCDRPGRKQHRQARHPDRRNPAIAARGRQGQGHPPPARQQKQPESDGTVPARQARIGHERKRKGPFPSAGNSDIRRPERVVSNHLSSLSACPRGGKPCRAHPRRSPSKATAGLGRTHRHGGTVRPCVSATWVGGVEQILRFRSFLVFFRRHRLSGQENM